jgi:hypothetical protein
MGGGENKERSLSTSVADIGPWMEGGMISDADVSTSVADIGSWMEGGMIADADESLPLRLVEERTPFRDSPSSFLA